MNSLFEIKIEKPAQNFSTELKNEAIEALEEGKVLFFPNLKFNLNHEEKEFLKPNTFDLKVKSLKYNLEENKLWSVKHFAQEESLKEMIKRHSLFSQELIENILPHYKNTIKFLLQIGKPLPFSAYILKAFKTTKSLRTKYDHYMLGLHDAMKLDDDYQKNAKKERIEFPPNSVWVCFSDKTSHAALSGRGLLEQTIYLPAEGMLDSIKSPLKIMEKILKRKLI